jgi:hypothetical protein
VNADPTRLPAPWRLLLLCLLLLSLLPAAGAARAQTLPFLEPGGVIRAELRYSTLVATLGEPPRSREWVHAGEPRLDGGIVFEYPERGLGFVVSATERPTRDPRIAKMQVRPPATERTHEGLAIGMRAEVAKPLVASVWRQRFADDSGGIYTVGIADVGGGPREGLLRFVGDKGLVLMEFDASTGPAPPWRMPRWVRGLVSLTVMAALAFGLSWLLKRLGLQYTHRWQRRDAPARTPLRDTLGGLLAVGGVVLLASGLGGPLPGDGYTRLVGLIGPLMGFSALMLAMLLWWGSARRGLRWIGAGAFVLVIGATLLAKLAR